MEAIPNYLPENEKKQMGKYICPVCRVERVDKSHIDWVMCPLVENAICVGCCIDIQSVSRSKNFAEHPYYDVIEQIGKMTGSSPKSIRVRCLQHQLNILNDDYPAIDTDAVIELRNYVKSLLDELSNV